MKFWKKATWLSLMRSRTPSELQSFQLRSTNLDRDVRLDVYLPPEYGRESGHFYPLVVFNDGQDLPRMDFSGILTELYFEQKIPPIVAVGVHAGDQRIREYGTARQPDYKGRGDKAPAYTAFLVDELLPYLYRQYRLSDAMGDCAIAGFSLGGLSAFDIGWARPDLFGVIGVFSGALWWRWSAVRPEDPDADRIIHDIVRNTEGEIGNNYFWFECGTQDEEEDRNNNGVIDAIDDTLALMDALRARGIGEEYLRYLEIENGRHDPETWGKAMPDFLEWAFVDEEGH